MKELPTVLWEAIEVLQWSRYLALAASTRKPSDAVIITRKVVAAIQAGPGEKRPAAVRDHQVNLPKAISTSFGSI